MVRVYVKGSEFESAGEIHDFLAAELGFPSYYGRNLSALYDVLTEICDDTELVLDLSGVKDERMLDVLEHMAEVMTDAADANEYLEVECVE